MITLGQLARIYPSSSLARRTLCLPGLQLAITLTHAGETNNRTAGLLATVAVETGSLKWLSEIWGPTEAQRSYVGRMGNRTLAEAKRYKGRGYVMLTGRNSYQEASREIGMPLEETPALAAEPVAAGKVLAWYWNTRDLNEACDLGDWRKVRRIVNGGWNSYAEFLACVHRALAVLA